MTSSSIKTGPEKPQAAADVLPGKLPARRMNPSLPPTLILHVDDDPWLRKVVVMVLQRAGYLVDSAANGSEAWAALKENRFDLVVTDLEMPLLDGPALARRIQTAQIPIPIVLTSGRTPTPKPADFPDLQLNAILVKPFSSAQLLEVVRAALQSRPPVAGGGLAPQFVSQATTMTPLIPRYSETSQARIERMARQIYEEEGRPPEMESEHWFRAEERLWNACHANLRPTARLWRSRDGLSPAGPPP